MPSATTDDLRAAERVLVYGVTGSGKSTAAVELGAVLGLPVHLVDEEIGWLPGWTERPRAEQRELAASLAAGERWVLDSAYGHWRDAVLPRVQVVVALDYPRHVSLTRLLRRTAVRWATQEPMCNGNYETARQILSKDSIVVWHFRSFRRKHQTITRLHEAATGVPVLRVRTPAELERVLEDLGRVSGPGRRRRR